MVDYSISDTILSKFANWFKDASEKEVNDPNAMSVATVSAAGHPSVRIVLMKDYDDQGWVFYTNLTSKKGAEIKESGFASLLFHWKSLRKQVRLDGPIDLVSEEEADQYFATRPRGSQIGAWASDQSSALPSRETLEERIAHYTEKFEGADVPRPPHWSGFRLQPQHIEFWTDQESRLHIREVFDFDGETGDWAEGLLFP